MLLWAVLLVVTVIGLVAFGLWYDHRHPQRRDPRLGRAAVEVDALFAPARRHVVEYHHAVQMHREDPQSPDDEDPDGERPDGSSANVEASNGGSPGVRPPDPLRQAARQAAEDRAHRNRPPDA